MNNPSNQLLDEVRLFKSFGLDYVELTVEAPEATPDKVTGCMDELLDTGLPFIGHMPWFFQITSPYAGVREAFISEAVGVLDTAVDLNMPYVTVHPDFLKLRRRMDELMRLTVESLRRLEVEAADRGIRLCFENFEREHISVEELQTVFDAIPDLGFTLDVGHGFMGAGNIDHIKLLISNFKDRLVNVHIHDNFGLKDDHLPLGAGKIDYASVVRELKAVGYNGNITLEIHSTDRDYIRISKEKLSKLL
jgi:sugar phosphate isomerase/epimerase